MNKHIGVVGAGNIGVSVTIDLLLKGFRVTLLDISTDILNKAIHKIEQEIRLAVMVQKIQPAQTDTGHYRERLLLTTDMADLTNAGFIIENTPEEWNIKEKVYRELSHVCPKDVCFGVNTSCISIARVAEITDRKDKVVGLHFMNPVYMMPTVEVMKSRYTSAETLKEINQLMKDMKKEAIIVNDHPGFVSNRISHLFMNEAAYVFQDNVASAEEIDNIFKKCFFHKMGPLETADLIGIDTVMKSLNVLYESYQDPKFRCCPLLVKMVAEGKLGRKTGAGFYNYNY
ncbi:3-hydroxyacyl-CoA dehydrogenase family protein [Chitinophaga qingshengii]|uniref:3-hydroxyacyl-CoA dehydrogenase family protein n=1 Tax=Chitinophaga qingshengii TaxID=1569794 RepID=A0ABR7TH22_9BACT|nr:3-hydroxyacyl-CoA dehydrogenase family protein [Chitinophaga qingshengii]MBC9929265.1 3-hydroxyacyl-CoA dehydrogenase family protein [Chitinophaga qingshengii]